MAPLGQVLESPCRHSAQYTPPSQLAAHTLPLGQSPSSRQRSHVWMYVPQYGLSPTQSASVPHSPPAKHSPAGEQ
jgi:hypothetical protein